MASKSVFDGATPAGAGPLRPRHPGTAGFAGSRGAAVVEVVLVVVEVGIGGMYMLVVGPRTAVVEGSKVRSVRHCAAHSEARRRGDKSVRTCVSWCAAYQST